MTSSIPCPPYATMILLAMVMTSDWWWDWITIRCGTVKYVGISTKYTMVRNHCLARCATGGQWLIRLPNGCNRTTVLPSDVTTLHIFSGGSGWECLLQYLGSDHNQVNSKLDGWREIINISRLYCNVTWFYCYRPTPKRIQKQSHSRRMKPLKLMLMTSN